LLRNEFDVLMNRFMEDWLPPTGEFWKAAWSLDVEETDKEVVYRAELPGFEPAEIDVSLTGDVLTIRAEHHVEPKGTAPDTPTERRRVERSVVLPEGVDPDKMTATYRNGILELRLPRVPEAAPRRIEVKT